MGHNQILPFDREAEYSALAAACLDNGLAAAVLALVEPEDFFTEEGRYIAEAVKRLYQSGTDIDALTLQRTLESIQVIPGKTAWEHLGGLAGISPVLLGSPHPYLSIMPTYDHAADHARLVKRAAWRRRLIEAAEKTAKTAYNDTLSDEEITNTVSGLMRAALAEREQDKAVSARDSASSFLDRLFDLRANPRPIGLPFPSPKYTELLGGMRFGDLTVFAGGAGVGKTTWAIATALICSQAGFPTDYLSFEMTIDQLENRAIGFLGGINSELLPQPHLLTEEQVEDAAEAAGIYADLPLSFVPPASLTIEDIWTRAVASVHTRGTRLLIVDYLQLIKHLEAGGRNYAQAVANTTRGLRLLALQENLAVLALSQLSRAGQQGRPQLSDLRWDSKTLHCDIFEGG